MAHEALVNKVVPVSELEQTVLSYVERIAKNDPLQLRMMKFGGQSPMVERAFESYRRKQDPE